MSHTRLVQDTRVKCCDRINGNEEKLAADKSRLVSVFQVKLKVWRIYPWMERNATDVCRLTSCMNITDEKRSKRGGGGWDVYRWGCSFSSEVASSYPHRGIKLEEQTSGGSKISKITAFKWPFFITLPRVEYVFRFFSFFSSSPLQLSTVQKTNRRPVNHPPSPEKKEKREKLARKSLT